MSQNKIGGQFEPGVNHGPANSKMQYEKVLSYIEEGVKEGATLHYGGKPVGENGYFIGPTIFTDVKPSMKVCGSCPKSSRGTKLRNFIDYAR